MYIYYDSEPEKKWRLISILLFFLLVLLVFISSILLVEGLGWGEELSFEVYAFADISNLSAPSATCIKNHSTILSTKEIYLQFLIDCELTDFPDYDASIFHEIVIIPYFLPMSQIYQPKAFYHYPFLVDDTEVIRIKTTARQSNGWFIYLVFLSRDSVSRNVVAFEEK
jgi:hypothetical protein